MTGCRTLPRPDGYGPRSPRPAILKTMDENRPPYSLQAPSATASPSALRLPAREQSLHVDDHLDPPEVTRWERIGGRRLEALPANAPHAMRHGDLDYVVRGKVAPGYRVASDLKTRFDVESDFASDTAILKEGVDPQTGRRYLEEIAFEVVSKQSLKVITDKAPRMIRRGVRRVFAVFLKQKKVCEWSPEQATWVELDRKSAIVDRCLIEPLEVASLVDAAAADNAVASGLVARGNPVVRRQRAQGQAEGRTQGQAEGRARGQAEAILEVLESRGLTPSEALRRLVLETTDLDQLRRWLRRAALVDSADQLASVG